MIRHAQCFILGAIIAMVLVACGSPEQSPAPHCPPLTESDKAYIVEYLSKEYIALLRRVGLTDEDAAEVVREVAEEAAFLGSEDLAPRLLLLVEKQDEAGRAVGLRLHWLVWKDCMPPPIVLGKGGRELARIEYSPDWASPVPSPVQVSRGAKPLPVQVSFPFVADVDPSEVPDPKQFVRDAAALIPEEWIAAEQGDWWVHDRAGNDLDVRVVKVVGGL